uniref:Uncharacterized protein n=1 Tax=Anguilla anguilla TaxID=7936 RepID=A0A0E9TZW2_ANGAN
MLEASHNSSANP